MFFNYFIFVFFSFSKSFEKGLTKRMTTDIYSICKENILENNQQGFCIKIIIIFLLFSGITINEDHRLFGVGMKNFRNFVIMINLMKNLS